MSTTFLEAGPEESLCCGARRDFVVSCKDHLAKLD